MIFIGDVLSDTYHYFLWTSVTLFATASHHPRCSMEAHEGELCSVFAGPPEALSIDIICLQETHVDNDVASRFTINLSNLISCQSRAKHERVM